jgi:hypothetical protein
VFSSEDAAKQAAGSLREDGHEIVSLQTERAIVRKQA